MPPTQTRPRILLVRFSSIGDVLLTTPLIRALREQYPDAHLAVLTKNAYRGLLAGNPRIDRLHTLDSNHRLRDITPALRAERFTHLLDLHGNLRSRTLRMLLPGRWSSYPKYAARRWLLVRTKRDLYPSRRPVVERYFDAARSLGVRPDHRPPELFVDPDAARRAADWLAGAGIGRERSIVALAPGAAHATKRWPLEHWIELLGRLEASGFDAVVVGGSEDAEVAERLVRTAPGRAASAAGRFDLQGSGALLQRAVVTVSGDTGLMHMATAVGRPVVALFGPTVEAFGFFPYSSSSIVLERPLPCRPCSYHGGPACPLGHHRCLREISPGEVEAAVRRSLS